MSEVLKKSLGGLHFDIVYALTLYISMLGWLENAQSCVRVGMCVYPARGKHECIHVLVIKMCVACGGHYLSKEARVEVFTVIKRQRGADIKLGWGVKLCVSASVRPCS